MKFPIKSIMGASALLLLTSAAIADISQAEDAAYRKAVQFTPIGFAMSPTNCNGMGTSGYTMRVRIPVTRGLDYVIIVGTDAAARYTQLYVYDEVGGLIIRDLRGVQHPTVKFRSSYNGEVICYMNMARTSGLAAYSVMVGRRGQGNKADTFNGEIPSIEGAAPAAN